MPTEPDQPIQTVAFVSLGCPKNLVDSEKMLGMLAESGIIPVALSANNPADLADANQDKAAAPTGDFAGADAVVINTCGFLEASKDESLSVIKDAIERKERGELKRVVVAGCLVQRHRAKILEWAPGIDAMLGVFDRDNIVRAVRGTTTERDTLTAGDTAPAWISANAAAAAKARGIVPANLTANGKETAALGYFESDAARLRLTPRHYAYLRISEGCNQNCTFCTIPSIRGKMRSKPLDRIRDEAKELIDDGVFELNLIGQDTTSFADDIGAGFVSDGKGGGAGGLVELLETLNDVIESHAKGNAWARLMYAYPTNFADAMIDALASLPHIVNYIDIPLQHASDPILDKMRRNVTAAHQSQLLHKLRDRVPGIAIRTTLITGFPGETEQDHELLLDFVSEHAFEALGVFEYSPEPGTPSARLDADPDLHVPAEIKSRRKAEIMQLQQQLAFDQAEFLASAFDEASPTESGHQFDLLIDKPVPTNDDSNCYAARTYFQAPEIDPITYVHSHAKLAPGELVRCVITGAQDYDLVATPIEDLKRSISLPIL